jgi:DNA-binding LytR/AlgR family response regulator
MNDSTPLDGRCFLIVEDEYLLAVDLTNSIESHGAKVLGPAATVEAALALIEENGNRVDGAVLDINVRGKRVYPVADALMSLGVPFIFTTGYDAIALPSRYVDIPRCEKPVEKQRLMHLLQGVRRT